MYITDRRELQKTWHGNMTSKEKDIYFCNTNILNMQQYQEDDRILVCIFGLRNNIINTNKIHKSMEISNIELFEELNANYI